MVEQVGSGVPRIRKAMLESDLPPPEFRTEGLFTLILSREKLKKNGVETREEKMKIIKERPKVTMREIAAEICQFCIINFNYFVLLSSKNY